VVEDVGIFAANSTAGFSVSDNGLLSYRATVPQVVRTSSLSRQEAYVIDFSNATSRIQISAAGAGGRSGGLMAGSLYPSSRSKARPTR